MRKVSRAVIAALFLQIFVTGVSAEAAPALRITAASANGTQVKVTWTPQKLSSKDIYEVEFTKIGTPKVVKSLKSKTTGIIAKLDPFSSYTVRVRQILTPKKWTALRTITTTTDENIVLKSSDITNTSLNLSWNAVVGATSYNLYSNKKLLANVSTPMYSVTGLTPGSVSEYSVIPLAGKIQGPVSSSIEASTLIETPLLPTVPTITANSATVKWIVDPNASKYEVILYDALGISERDERIIEGSLGSTTFSSLFPLTNYTVGIKSIYSGTTSKQSPLASFTTLRPAVTGNAISNITTTAMTLSWTQLPSATSYEVYRDGSLIASAVSSTLSSYVFSSLAPGQRYRLGVRAVFTDGTKSIAYTEMAESIGTTTIDPAFRPSISIPPVIELPYANVPIIGATLTTSIGTWASISTITGYSYQWQRSIDGGSTYSDLVGATASSYVVTVSDNTYLLRVKVSATNANGTGVSVSSASSAVASVYNIQVPIVRGNAVAGEILEVSDGTWSSRFPITLSYKWSTSRTGGFIANAVSPSLTVPSTEAGYTITAQVTASTSHGFLAITSPSRGLVTIVGNTVLPVVSGTLRVGGTLSVTDGTWLNLGNDSTATYQWQSSTDATLWNNIAGATSSTYVLKAAQAGTYIRAQVFNTKSGSAAVLANSISTGLVPVLNIVNATAPVVAGAWTVGTSLSASSGSWSSSGTYTYQWQSSSDGSTWADISSATAASYVLTSNEASKFVRVQVINTSSSGSGIAYSSSRSKVGAPFNTVAPAVSGTVKIGSTQTVTNGTWSNTPTTYGYQWQKSADGILWSDISGATAATYEPTFDVANLLVRVNVSAGNAVDTATVTSAVIQSFLPPQATIIPVVTGTKTVGQTLTSSAGTWPSTSSGYSYQWQRSSDNGVSWSNIVGATASTYVLVAGDAGYQIRSQVSLTANSGSSSAYSLATTAVAP
jgi:large repetitive protein